MSQSFNNRFISTRKETRFLICSLMSWIFARRRSRTWQQGAPPWSLEWSSTLGGRSQWSEPAESVPPSAEMSEDTRGNSLTYAGAEARVQDARNAATCRCLRPFDAPLVPNAWAVLREKSLNAGTDSRVKSKLMLTLTQ